MASGGNNPRLSWTRAFSAGELQELRDKARALGLCPVCLKRDLADEPGDYKTCQRCREGARKRMEDVRAGKGRLEAATASKRRREAARQPALGDDPPPPWEGCGDKEGFHSGRVVYGVVALCEGHMERRRAGRLAALAAARKGVEA